MHSYQRLLLVGVSLAASTAAAAQPLEGDTTRLVRFRDAATAFTAFSGVEDSIRSVVREPAEWRALWGRINRAFVPAPELPPVDFSREMIVVAALGRRPTAGYDVVIGHVDLKPTGIEIEVRRTSPAPGCPVSAVVTHPVDVARIPLSNLPVRFRDRDIVIPCTDSDSAPQQSVSHPPEDTLRRVHVLPALGLRVGTPQKASVALGVVVGQDWQKNGHDFSRNVALFVEPGISGGRGSVAYVYRGFGGFGSGVGIAASVLRTWKDPWTVRANQSYVGGEAILWPIVFVGPRIGLFRNVSSTELSRKWFVSFDFGIGL